MEENERRERGLELLRSAGEAAGKMLDAAIAAVEDQDQFHRYIVSDKRGSGEQIERTFEKMDTKAIKEMTGTIKELVGIVRDVYGVGTQERTIEVVFPDDTEEWAQ